MNLSGMAVKISPHSSNQRVVDSKRLDGSDSSMLQTSAPREQAAGLVTLQVPSAQRARRDFTAVSKAQIATRTMMTESASMRIPRGLTSFG